MNTKNIKIFALIIAIFVLLFILVFILLRLSADQYNLNDNFFSGKGKNNKASTTEQSISTKNNRQIYNFTAKDKLDEKSIKEGLDQLRDSNNDGIPDVQAVKMGLDPKNFDSDHDGIFDADEISITHTDPLNPDSDGDGYNDLTEVRSGNNPNGMGRLENRK